MSEWQLVFLTLWLLGAPVIGHVTYEWVKKRFQKPPKFYHAELELAPGQSTLSLKKNGVTVSHLVLTNWSATLRNGMSCEFEDVGQWIARHKFEGKM